MVDTLGLILGVLVTPANVSDPARAAMLLREVVARFGWLRHFWADSTYGGSEACSKPCVTGSPGVDCAWKSCAPRQGVKGFAVQPKRWINERTFRLAHPPPPTGA